jgi:hypothetical protein
MARNQTVPSIVRKTSFQKSIARFPTSLLTNTKATQQGIPHRTNQKLFRFTACEKGRTVGAKQEK